MLLKHIFIIVFRLQDVLQTLRYVLKISEVNQMLKYFNVQMFIKPEQDFFFSIVKFWSVAGCVLFFIFIHFSITANLVLSVL